MIKEMTAEELDASCRTYIALQVQDMNQARQILRSRYSRVEEDEAGFLRIYDLTEPETIVRLLYENGIIPSIFQQYIYIIRKCLNASMIAASFSFGVSDDLLSSLFGRL